MRLRYIAMVLGLAALAQTGCKCCHSCGAVPPPPPPPYPVQTSPPPFAPAVANAPAVGMLLPATDPDHAQAEPLVPQARPMPTSFNRLTSWTR